MFRPFGTSGRNLEIGSSSLSCPSCTNCMMTVDVIVLVLLPIRTESAMESGAVFPTSPVPREDQSPDVAYHAATPMPSRSRTLSPRHFARPLQVLPPQRQSRLNRR